MVTDNSIDRLLQQLLRCMVSAIDALVEQHLADRLGKVLAPKFFPEAALVERFRIANGQQADIGAIDVPIHVEIEIREAIQIFIDLAFRLQEAQRNSVFRSSASIDRIIDESALNTEQVFEGFLEPRREGDYDDRIRG